MSKIDEQIKKLREQEKRLEQEKLKVQFLTHILGSVKGYNETGFVSVKTEVIGLLEPFINKSIEAIETGSTIEIVLKSAMPATSNPVSPSSVPNAVQTETYKPKPAPDNVHEKSMFALDNRHLANKNVSVSNNENITIKGKVVGLDAPFVIVKTDTGPTIKVPLEKVSLE